MTEKKKITMTGTIAHAEYVEVEVPEDATEEDIDEALSVQAIKQFEEGGGGMRWVVLEKIQKGFEECDECGATVPEAEEICNPHHEESCSCYVPASAEEEEEDPNDPPLAREDQDALIRIIARGGKVERCGECSRYCPVVDGQKYHGQKCPKRSQG